MAFNLKLSAKTRHRIDEEQREAIRLYNLPDRWLARELIRMARVMRSSIGRFGPDDYVYDASLLWHVVPEIAYRLGETQFLPHEGGRPEIRQLTNEGLRMVAGVSWRNCSTFLYQRTLEGRMFFREACNGSPFVYALDRLALPDEKDVIARLILEVSRYRKIPSTGVWTPAMLSA